MVGGAEGKSKRLEKLKKKKMERKRGLQNRVWHSIFLLFLSLRGIVTETRTSKTDMVNDLPLYRFCISTSETDLDLLDADWSEYKRFSPFSQEAAFMEPFGAPLFLSNFFLPNTFSCISTYSRPDRLPLCVPK